MVEPEVYWFYAPDRDGKDEDIWVFYVYAFGEILMTLTNP